MSKATGWLTITRIHSSWQHVQHDGSGPCQSYSFYAVPGLLQLTIVFEDRVFECLIDRKVEPHIGDHANHAGQPPLPQRNDALLWQADTVYALVQKVTEPCTR